MHTIYFDGACELDPVSRKRNPGGIATYGWLIKNDAGTIAYGYGEAGRGETASNNMAEYTALIKSLEAFLSLGLAGPLVKNLRDAALESNQGRFAKLAA